jgi:hypothetical protein
LTFAQAITQIWEEEVTQEDSVNTSCAYSHSLWFPPANASPEIQNANTLQAITREWDEKATQDELRGARASARQIARVGIYDRNKGLKAVRRKAIQNPAAKTDEEAAKLAANAARQIQEAAAKSIQPTKESLFQEAAGVKRSFERAEALPEGECELPPRTAVRRLV